MKNDHTVGTSAGLSPQNAVNDQSVETLALVEEALRVDKREVTSGRVRIETVTDTVEELARATLDEETVEVTRVPIGREVSAAPAVRTEDGVVIVPVMEEIVIVEKRLVLKEELHIRRQVTQENVEVPVTLRKQRAVVERLSPEGQSIEGET
jgi:uncharacterized protein (TIGR02271 family)